ncbi:MAG: EF-P lysine aminoacylase EpmA [Pseudomonadales bacterium]|nr:EF-P lysine aminoacylase EpmA [Pseudomonadales bacterium]
MVDWKPGASSESLHLRAQLLAEIRQFFAAREVLEIDTPLLAPSTVTDVYIQSLEAKLSDSTGDSPYFLQTSPEFAMKRLLAAGVGSIYQICKAFRKGETGKLHNPEFTILEWYRTGYSMSQLMDEVELLIGQLFNLDKIPRFSYRLLFEEFLGFNPHSITGVELSEIAESHIELNNDALTDTDYLQLLMSACIEPQMPDHCFVYDYPVAQAALAAVEENEYGEQVAKRFELYCQRMELANGYYELTNLDEQQARFKTDLHTRSNLQLPTYPVDQKLLAAMRSGLPECAGVALGIDRLVMIASGASTISEVMAFSIDRI